MAARDAMPSGSRSSQNQGETENSNRILTSIARSLYEFEVEKDINKIKQEMRRKGLKFNSNNIEKTMTCLRMQYLHLFLIYYPKSMHTKSFGTLSLYNTFSSTADKLRHEFKHKTPAEYYFTIRTLINVTEMMIMGASSYKLNWYSYYKCSRCGSSRPNYLSIQNPVLKHLSEHYNVTMDTIGTLVGLITGCSCGPNYTDCLYNGVHMFSDDW